MAYINQTKLVKWGRRMGKAAGFLNEAFPGMLGNFAGTGKAVQGSGQSNTNSRGMGQGRGQGRGSKAGCGGGQGGGRGRWDQTS